MPDSTEVPYSNPEAETALICCAILDAPYTFSHTQGLSVDDFWDDKNRVLWSALRTLHERGPIDGILLRSYLAANHLEEKAGGQEYFDAIATFTFTASMADAYAKTIRSHSAKRALFRTAEALKSLSMNGVDADEALDQARLETEFLRASFSKPDSGFAIVQGDDLVTEPDEDLTMLWPGLVAKSHVLLVAGTAKTGKSWLIYAFLGALSRGEPWLNHPTPADGPHRALIVSEEPRSRVKAKLRRFGVRGAVILARGSFPPGTSWRELVQKAGEIAKKIGCSLVIFDTLSGLARIEEENNASEANTAFGYVLDMAGREDLAAIVVHHAPNSLRRGQGKPSKLMRAVDFVRGSGALQANPDAILGIDNDPDDPDGPRRLLVGEGRFELPSFRTFVRYLAPGHDGQDCPGGYEVEGHPTEVSREESVRKKVEADLKDQNRLISLLEREAPKTFPRTTIRELLGGGKKWESLLPLCFSLGKIARTGEGSNKDPFRYGSLPASSAGSLDTPRLL